MKTRRLAVAALLALIASTAHAAEWPSRPIVVLDGFAPGGGTDVLMRVMAVEMTKTFGQSVVVENRSGASGHIAAEAVARAAPDGQMIMIHTASMITSRSLYAKLGYDVVRDLAPVTQIVRIPNVLVVPPALPVKNIREFLTLAKRRPGELVFASTGLGSISHVVGELFQQVAGIRSIHVPYRGAAPATTALISGEAAYGFIVPLVVRMSRPASCARWPSPRSNAPPCFPKCRRSTNPASRASTSRTGTGSGRRRKRRPQS